MWSQTTPWETNYTRANTTVVGSLNIIILFTLVTPRHYVLLTRAALMPLCPKAVWLQHVQKSLNPRQRIIPWGLQSWQMFAATQKSWFQIKTIFPPAPNWNKMLRSLKIKVCAFLAKVSQTRDALLSTSTFVTALTPQDLLGQESVKFKHPDTGFNCCWRATSFPHWQLFTGKLHSSCCTDISSPVLWKGERKERSVISLKIIHPFLIICELRRCRISILLTAEEQLYDL